MSSAVVGDEHRKRRVCRVPIVAEQRQPRLQVAQRASEAERRLARGPLEEESDDRAVALDSAKAQPGVQVASPPNWAQRTETDTGSKG